MTRERVHFLFLNVGHFYDHLFMLLFATVAALALIHDWGLTYAQLIPYATPGFIAFGVCAIPAGWLGDKWSRAGMMAVFFIGIGISSILTGFAQSPVQIGAGLLAIGIFGAIYHPVGIAMVVEGREKTGMAIAVNGVFGNIGVASAALIAGFLIDVSGWRSAFIAPGIISLATGIAYLLFLRDEVGRVSTDVAAPKPAKSKGVSTLPRSTLIHILLIVTITTAIGSFIFQSTTFALPKIFEERLGDIAETASAVGIYAFAVFTLAAFAQLIVGWTIDRYSVRIVFGAVAAVQVVFLGLMVGLSGPWTLLIATGFMLAVFGQIPINDVLLGRITNSEWRARIFGARFIIGFTVMASAVPILAWLHANWGFDVLFGTLATFACVTLLSVLLLPRTRAVTGQEMPAEQPAE